jgi:Poly(3-hydroxybutyrate) depolymerase
MRLALITIFALAFVAIAVFFLNAKPAVDPLLLKPAAFSYPESIKASCFKTLPAPFSGIIDDNKTVSGAGYNLRTPSNYRPTIAHPLIIVFAPAGAHASRSERLVHLTKEATEAGFIIAYAHNIRLSLKAIEQLSSIPLDIQEKWCIDPSRIFYTGHSDGGTISNALTFLPEFEFKPTAIAPSAAGMDEKSLKEYACPAPLPVMVFHNKEDKHFESFGKQAADWWAKCNQCEQTLDQPDENGCRLYKKCPESSKTYYCESSGSHAKWPDKNQALLRFFNNRY